jgi:hypothetical protein
LVLILLAGIIPAYGGENASNPCALITDKETDVD